MPGNPPTPSSSSAPGSRGRDQARIVRRYLAAVDGARKGGRRRTVDALTHRILKIDELLVSADPLSRLHLTQERIDLHGELIRYGNGVADDVSALEKLFVKVARPYADRGGITYAAWRQVGVDPEVLERAGISRTAPGRNGSVPPAHVPALTATDADADVVAPDAEQQSLSDEVMAPATAEAAPMRKKRRPEA